MSFQFISRFLFLHNDTPEAGSIDHFTNVQKGLSRGTVTLYKAPFSTDVLAFVVFMSIQLVEQLWVTMVSQANASDLTLTQHQGEFQCCSHESMSVCLRMFYLTLDCFWQLHFCILIYYIFMHSTFIQAVIMPPRTERSSVVVIKPEELRLECEWQECTEVFDCMHQFTEHVNTHLQEFFISIVPNESEPSGNALQLNLL